MSEIKDPRILFAAERTLLAWNRTGLSLIAFGFVVERAGLLMRAVAPKSTDTAHVAQTFWIGILFILLGVLASAYSARQYSIFLRTLSAAEFPPGYTATWGAAVNGVVALLGACLAIVLIVGHM